MSLFPAVVVRALCSDRDGRVLLVRRADGGRLDRHWELPGGKAEKREKPWAALIRECREETGLALEVARTAFQIRRRETPSGRTMHELVFAARPRDGALRLSDEHDAFAWWRSGEPLPGPLTEATAEALAIAR